MRTVIGIVGKHINDNKIRTDTFTVWVFSVFSFGV